MLQIFCTIVATSLLLLFFYVWVAIREVQTFQGSDYTLNEADDMMYDDTMFFLLMSKKYSLMLMNQAVAPAIVFPRIGRIYHQFCSKQRWLRWTNMIVTPPFKWLLYLQKNGAEIYNIHMQWFVSMNHMRFLEKVYIYITILRYVYCCFYLVNWIELNSLTFFGIIRCWDTKIIFSINKRLL